MAGDSGQPSIETIINARMGNLESGLRSAEGLVAKSAAKMGNSGDKAGSLFDNALVKRLAGLGSSLAVINTAFRGAVESVKAGESGADIGMAFARGAVEGAKSIPIIGSFVELIDHAINGAEKALEAGMERARLATVAQVEKSAALVAERSKASEGLHEFATKEVGPELKADEAAERAQEESIEKLRAHSDKVKAINDAALHDAETSVNASEASIASARKRFAAVELKRKADVAEGLRQIDEKYNDALNKVSEEQRAKEAAAEEKRLAEVEKAAKKEADIQAQALKARQNLAVREMETRLEELQQSAEPSRADRLGELADKAANPLIQSGQTALGQFKFAGGSGDEVMRNAEEQLSKLEAIEGLQREMRDYQRRIADGIAA